MTQVLPDSSVLITCEHGGNTVPADWRNVFPDADATLQSHRGWDPGALPLARRFAKQLNATLHFSRTTRLLVELNRSLHHRALFSEFTSTLTADQKETLLSRHWHPYRTAVTQHIEAEIQQGRRVVHLSVHSFTPIWYDIPRTTDIGLLFDPRRAGESTLCRKWQQLLRSALSQFKIHRNRPYRGAADGFTTYLRRQFPPTSYIGVELEVNQKLIADNAPTRSLLHTQLPRLFLNALQAPAEPG